MSTSSTFTIDNPLGHTTRHGNKAEYLRTFTQSGGVERLLFLVTKPDGCQYATGRRLDGKFYSDTEDELDIIDVQPPAPVPDPYEPVDTGRSRRISVKPGVLTGDVFLRAERTDLSDTAVQSRLTPEQALTISKQLAKAAGVEEKEWKQHNFYVHYTVPSLITYRDSSKW